MRRVFENDSGSKSGRGVPANYYCMVAAAGIFFFPLSGIRVHGAHARACRNHNGDNTDNSLTDLLLFLFLIIFSNIM